MKRVVYIAFVAVGMFAVSCSKENIRPNGPVQELPSWRSSMQDSDNTGSSSEGTITDPNNDKDESSRRKN